MANGVTTEWEDILVKKGIWNPREKVTPQSEFNQHAQDRAQEYDYGRQLKEQDVDELEDELDEDFIKEFKEIRMQQMLEEARKPKFGQMIEISRDQYTQEVNEAPKGKIFKKGAFVIIHLYQNYLEKCNLINHHFAELAQHYTDIKFIKILSTRCIENFPDHNLPCVIIYKDGVLHKNIPNFDRLNYTYKLTKISIIMVLMKLDIIPYEKLDSDDVILQFQEEIDNIKKYTKGKIGFQQGKQDDVSDEEHDDRGFSNNQL